jgi:polyisoprenoid-binding protein YceI
MESLFNQAQKLFIQMNRFAFSGLWLVIVLGLLSMEVRAQSFNGPANNRTVKTASEIPDRLPITIDPASRVWLDGSANVVDFRCAAGIIESSGYLLDFDMQVMQSGSGRPHGDIELLVKIPVQQLNCGKAPINRDMRKTLNAEEYPFIEYKLRSSQLMCCTDDFLPQTMEIETLGDLTLAGNTRQERIIVSGQFIGTYQFRITGSHVVKMSDFGLEPPSPMMGLIKVHDEMIVNFDAIITLKDPSIISKFMKRP